MSWTLTTLNVNGLRSAVRKGFTSWRPKEKCDVLCLQELRMQEDQMEKDHRPPRGWESVRVQAEKKRLLRCCRLEPSSCAGNGHIDGPGLGRPRRPLLLDGG